MSETQEALVISLTSDKTFLVAEMQILPYMATSHAVPVPDKKGNIHISATRNVVSDAGLKLPWLCV